VLRGTRDLSPNVEKAEAASPLRPFLFLRPLRFGILARMRGAWLAILLLSLSCGGGDASSVECRADADCDRGYFCRAGVCLRWSSGFSDAGQDAAPDAG